MADNLTTTTTLASIPSAKNIATYEIATFSGDSNVHIAPTVLGTISGAEGLRAFTEVGTGNPLPVSDAGGSLTVDGTVAISGTVNVQGAATAATTYLPVRVSDGTNFITPSSDATHDLAVGSTGPQIMLGAVAHGANPTAVTAGDAVRWTTNRAGVPFVIGGHPNVVTIEAAYTAAQTDAAIVTVGVGTKIVVTACGFVCDKANTVDVGVRVGFGATTTPTTTGVVLTHPGIAAGSGYERGDGSGIIGIGADGEDLRITCEAPTTGSARVLVSYFTIES